MTKELTHGKPLPLILQFAFPLILGYMLQQLYSLCDTVIVGRCLGVNELAAVGSTGAVSFLVVGFATGMCTGMSIPVAQAFGAGDYQKLRKYLANSFYLSALISIVMTVGTIIFTGDLLRLMKTPEELYDFAYDYIFTVFAGISATILYNLLSSMLRSIGDSRTCIQNSALCVHALETWNGFAGNSQFAIRVIFQNGNIILASQFVNALSLFERSHPSSWVLEIRNDINQLAIRFGLQGVFQCS